MTAAAPGRHRRGWLMAVLAVLALLAAACSSAGNATNMLEAVQNRDLVRVVSDPNFRPQSFYDQLIGRWRGFDVDVATEIARRLGVDVQFSSGVFEDVQAGNWQPEWDLSVGSMTITPQRSERLNFTTPYYYDTAAVAVNEDNTDVVNIETDLAGKTIGVTDGSTYESYLRGTLELAGQGTIPSVIQNPLIVTYGTDADAIDALSAGDLDAVISARPELQEAIDNGTARIRIIGGSLFTEELAAAVVKDTPLDNMSFVQRVSHIIDQMHADGTLSDLSDKWYGTNLTQLPA
jgi:polar amino acid transport system substrate-binding protein